MNCPMCNLVVAKIPEQLSSPHCACPKDAHVGLLLEYAETLEFHEDKLRDTLRMLDLRERQLADCTRAMREVSTAIHTDIADNRFDDDAVLDVLAFADKLDAARSGK